MKSAKTVLLSLFFTIGFVFPSCEKGLGSCPQTNSESIRYFDIQGLDAIVFQNNIGFEFIEPLDTIPFLETTGIYMMYLVDYHALSPTFSLMNSAMACSPIRGGYDGSKTEKLESISIITLNDFDDEHPANSSINDLFEAQVDFYNDDNVPLAEFLDNQTENIKNQELLLKLKQAPTLNSAFHFKISVDLSTGESYDTESSPVYFKN